MAQDDDIEASRIKPERSKRRRATKRETAKRDLRLVEKLIRPMSSSSCRSAA